MPAAIGRAAYRVVQEAVTNARRHAPGQAVRVELAGHPGTRLAIDIRNLIGLAERVELAGGELEHSQSEQEFHLRAWLPWPS